MPSLLIKNIDHKLLADVNHAAAVAEMNQREWVIDALAQAVGGTAPLDTRTQHPPRVEPMTADPFPALTHGPSGTCRLYRCGQCTALGKKF